MINYQKKEEEEEEAIQFVSFQLINNFIINIIF
jgi:hypothetical protein